MTRQSVQTVEDRATHQPMTESELKARIVEFVQRWCEACGERYEPEGDVWTNDQCLEYELLAFVRSLKIPVRDDT